MPKFISILRLNPEVEVQQVLDALPDLEDDVLARIAAIHVLALPNQATREFMFETTDESTANNAAFVSLQVFNLLVHDRRFGEMHTLQATRIGVRRSDSGQGRGAAEILGEVK